MSSQFNAIHLQITTGNNFNCNNTAFSLSYHLILKLRITQFDVYYYYYYYFLWLCSPAQAMAFSSARFLGYINRRATFGTIFWTSDHLVAETSTWQHTQQANIHAAGAIRTHDPSRRAAVDLRLRLRGHWDRQFNVYVIILLLVIFNCNWIDTLWQQYSTQLVDTRWQQYSRHLVDTRWQQYRTHLVDTRWQQYSIH
jgi:hypothetical protein